MKFIDYFEAFLKNEVNLNNSRLETLQQKANALETFLSDHEMFSSIFLDMIPAGSWAHQTIIKPVADNDEFDADVLLYIKEQPNWKPKHYLENLYTAFHNSSTYKSLAGRMTRCVRIDYAGDFHVDVVPYLDRAGRHYITNRSKPEGEGRFELSDPESFSKWMDDRQRATNQTFIKCVRLVKYLRDYKNTFVCKSIILTTLLGSQVNPIEATFNPDLFADVPTTFTTILGRLAANLPETMPAVLDPAGTGENFTDRYKDDWNYENFRARLINYAKKAKQALDEKDRELSQSLWQEIFGEGLEITLLEKSVAVKSLSASSPTTGEQFITQPPFGFTLLPKPLGTVRITARCTGWSAGDTKRKNGFRQFDLDKNGNQLAKNRSVVFRAKVENIAAPYELYWKVRNGGEEAATVSQLRGEISKDGGDHKKTETTSYKGIHYVECYVVKNNTVMAKDRQTVIVTS